MFSDLYGEVSVRPDDADDAYEFAELSMILYHNDRIRTKAKSGAIICFADLSTFVMKPDSVIVLDTRATKESKFKLIAGTILVNIKRILEDGNVDIEMTQAVAGIKGTTLVCEESDGKSTLKVLEGSVELTPVNGEPILVQGGEMVTAENGKIGKIMTFSPSKELLSWPEKAQNNIHQALSEKGVRLEEERQTSGVTAGTLMLVIAVASILLLIFVSVVHGRKKRRSRQSRGNPVQFDAGTVPFFLSN